MRNTRVAIACVLAMNLVPGLAAAQNYPTRTVTIVIPFAAGASSDIETRIYAQKLSESLGQSFVADFKPGAGGTLGTAYVAKSAPDGYTLMAMSGGFNTAPSLYPDLPYDAQKDFTPVSLMSLRSTAILVSPAAPYRNIKEYVAYAKANPRRINVATAGSGGSPHLNAAWFHGLTNTEVTYVHYKGTSAASIDLVAGRVDVFFGTLLSALPNLKAGKVRAIAIANSQRSPLMPDLATAQEQGVPGYDYSSIFGIIGPGGMQPAVLNKLAGELAKIARMPDVVKKIEADGGMAVGSTPEQFRTLIAGEIVRYRKIIQDQKIRLEE
jgi:tripartite-type tricarboxylate transporter receptor subunit TctC